MAVLRNTLIPLLLACGVAVAGEPAADAPAATSTATATSDTAVKKEASAEEGKETKAAVRKTCERVSGSRIRPNPARDCDTGFGPMRTYTQEDIQRTGQTDLNEALRMLDPIFH